MSRLRPILLKYKTEGSEEAANGSCFSVAEVKSICTILEDALEGGISPVILNTPGIALVVLVGAGVYPGAPTPARIREAMGICSGGIAGPDGRRGCSLLGATGVAVCTLGGGGTTTVLGNGIPVGA